MEGMEKMIKHIVMWKLEEKAEGNTKLENAKIIKERLEALIGVIPEIIELEVGIDVLGTNQSYDVVLVSKFKNLEELDVYAKHPKHLEVGEFVGKVRKDRVSVDYEV